MGTQILYSAGDAVRVEWDYNDSTLLVNTIRGINDGSLGPLEVVATDKATGALVRRDVFPTGTTTVALTGNNRIQLVRDARGRLDGPYNVAVNTL